MEKLLQLKPRPDAVFCFNDPAAVGAMNAILAAGLRIPEDVRLSAPATSAMRDRFECLCRQLKYSATSLARMPGIWYRNYREQEVCPAQGNRNSTESDRARFNQGKKAKFKRTDLNLASLRALGLLKAPWRGNGASSN